MARTTHLLFSLLQVLYNERIALVLLFASVEALFFAFFGDLVSSALLSALRLRLLSSSAIMKSSCSSLPPSTTNIVIDQTHAFLLVIIRHYKVGARIVANIAHLEENS